MAQDVQGMLIRIEATTAQLRKELAAADRAVSGSSSKIDKELGLVDKAFARMGLNAEQSRKAIGSAMAGITAAAAGGVAGLGALVVSTANSAREIQNLSQVANASTTEFQRYAVGAKTVGVEQEKLADILKDVNDRVGDFLTTGGGEMKDFFENIAPRIGVTAEQFRKLSGPQSLQLFYNSLEKANLSQAEMTFYMESMADETTALIPLLRDGGAGFSAMADEAERLGLVMSEKTLKQFDQFNAQMDTAKMAAGGFGTQIATEALPALSELNGLLIEFAQDSEAASVVGDALGVVLKGVATVAVGLSTTFANLGRAIGGLAAAASAAASMEFAQASSIIDEFTADNERATAEAEQRIKKLWAGEYAEAGKRAVEVNRSVSESSGQLGAAAKKAVEEQKKAVDEQLKAIDALVAKYDPAAKAQADYEKAVALADKALKENKLTTEQYQKVVQGLYTDLNKPIWEKHNKAADEAAAAIKKIDDQLQSVRDRLDPAGKAARDFAEEQDFLKKAVDEGRLSLEEYNKLLPLLGKEYDENTKATSDWAQWTEGALDRVDSAFADAWRNIGDGFSSFRDSLTNAFKQMLAELAHMAITKPIIMQIGAMMGIGNGTQGNNGIWGSLLGGSSGSGGGGVNFGQLASYGQSIYSAATGWGQAAYTGWQAGGFNGAVSGVGNYYGGMIGSAANTVGGWFGGNAAATVGSNAVQGGAGWMLDGAGNLVNTATQSGANAVGSGFGGASASAINPAMWAIAAILGSKSFYEAGYTLDRNQVANQKLSKISFAIDPALSAVAYSMLQATEVAEKIVSPIVGEKWGNILSLGPLFSGITNTVSKALFGGAWETKDGGLALGADGGDLTAQQYIYQKKKGGLFSSSKKRTRYSALDDETMAALQETFDATQAGVASIFEALSFTVEDGALDGLQIARKKISTKGKTEEEISKALNEWFGSVGDSMVDELNKVFSTGLDYDLAGMQAFVGNLKGVNEVLRYLDVGMYDATVAGGKLAEALSAATGGLDALAANSQTYYSAFFSDAEKVEDTIDSIKRAFESADVELASSREAYRAMVEDIDLTTEAGQEMFATLMELSGQAAQYYSIVEQQAAAAASAAESAAAQLLANVSTYYDQFTTVGQKTEDTLLGIVAQFDALGVALPGTRDGFIAAVEALDQSSESGKKMFETLMALSGQADAYYDILEARAAASMANTASAAIAGSKGALSALSAAINAQKSSVTSAYQSQTDSIKSAIDSASDSLSEMRSVAGSLRSAVNGLRLESEQYAAQSRRSAQQTISQALSGGGRIQMNAQLERALDTVSQSSEDLFGSFEDYARDYWQTYFAIESLADKADDQLSADEQAVKALESQLDQAQRFHDSELERLDGVLEGANAQLEALLGIDTGVKSLEAALGEFAAAIAAGKQLQDANSSIRSVTGLAGVKRQVTSEGYLLDENGDYMKLFGEAMRVVGNKVLGGAGASLNIGADGQLSWANGDYEKWAKEAGIPGFASGGSHSGGLRLVGENGPELEVTGPSRIYNASQTAAMLGGGGDASSEVRGLRSDFAGMMDALRSVAKHTMQTAKRVEFLERWDFDGLPKERATA